MPGTVMMGLGAAGATAGTGELACGAAKLVAVTNIDNANRDTFFIVQLYKLNSTVYLIA